MRRVIGARHGIATGVQHQCRQRRCVANLPGILISSRLPNPLALPDNCPRDGRPRYPGAVMQRCSSFEGWTSPGKHRLITAILDLKGLKYRWSLHCCGTGPFRHHCPPVQQEVLPFKLATGDLQMLVCCAYRTMTNSLISFWALCDLIGMIPLLAIEKPSFSLL